MRIVLLLSVLAASVASAGVTSLTPAMPDSERVKARWQKRFASRQELVGKGGAPHVFIGDGMTQLFETGAGREVWKKYFGISEAPYPALNLGYCGDCTEHVLYRISRGELDGYEARTIVLAIGANNTGCRSSSDEPPADTILGVHACVEAIRARQPRARIVLCPIFPCGAAACDEKRRRNDTVNRELSKFADGKTVFWCDFTQRLMRRDGSLSAEIFPDCQHLSERGYEIWANAIIPYLNGFAASVYPEAIADGETAAEPVAALRPQTRFAEDWWRKKLARNRARIADCAGAYDIAMLGDSITHYWEVGEGLDDSRDIEILEKKYRILNCGYGGDRIEHLLWRVKNGELDGYRARLVTLMIGTNNSADRPEDILRGVREVIGEIFRKQPQAKILLMGYLPSGERKDDPRRVKMDAVRPALRLFADGTDVIWFDCSDRFLNADGTTRKEMYDYEYLHPSTEGYRVWREALEPVLERLLGRR